MPKHRLAPNTEEVNLSFKVQWAASFYKTYEVWVTPQALTSSEFRIIEPAKSDMFYIHTGLYLFRISS